MLGRCTDTNFSAERTAVHVSSRVSRTTTVLSAGVELVFSSGMIGGGRLTQDVDHVVGSGGRVDEGEAQCRSPLPHSRNTEDETLLCQAGGPAVIVLVGPSGPLEDEHRKFRLEQEVKGGHGQD